MRRIAPIVLLVLLISLLSSSNIAVSGQNANATLYSASILQSSVNYGQQINIEVDAYDPDGILEVFVELHASEQIPGNGPVYVSSVGLSYNPASFYYEGVYTIDQYDPAHFTIGLVVIRDSFENYGYFGHVDIFSEEPQTFYTNYVEVFGTTPDYSLPQLTSFGYNTSFVNYGGSINFYVQATDDLSGISNVYVGIFRDVVDSEYVWDDEYIGSFGLTYYPLINTYNTTWTPQIWNDAGDYYIGIIDIVDRANNWNYYETSSYAENQISKQTFYLQNPSYQPVIAAMFFNYTTIDVWESQTLFLEIANFPFENGWLDLVFDNGNYYEWLDTINVSPSMYNPSTGLYEVPFDTEVDNGPIPQNTDIYVDFIYMNGVNNPELHLREGNHFYSPSFQVTGELNDPFEISIEPTNGMNYLGQETKLELIFKNNKHFSVGGAFNLTVIPTDGSGSFVLDSYNVSLTEYEERIEFSEFTFNNSGTYEINAFFLYNGTDTYSSTVEWNVVEIPEELIVEISPESGSSRIDQVARFNINITSTFRSDLVGLNVDFMAISQNGSHFETFNIDVSAFTSNNIQFDVIFDVAGIYEYNVTVTDGAEFWWSNTYVWEVIEESNPPPNTDQPTNSDDEPTNSSGGPEIQLPGFELYLSIIGFTSMLLITYQRRRY